MGTYLIGAREKFLYTSEGLKSFRVYIFNCEGNFIERVEGSNKTKTFSHPRPFNLFPSQGAFLIENIFSDMSQIDFITNTRWKSRPLIHLVFGESGLGKSTLFLDNSRVYETDYSLQLEKEMLYSSIIIIGNRSDFNPSDVIKYFYKYGFYPEFVLVEFKK